MYFHLYSILLNSKKRQISFQNTEQRTRTRTKIVYACMFRDKTLSAVPRLEKVPSGIYYLT